VFAYCCFSFSYALGAVHRKSDTLVSAYIGLSNYSGFGSYEKNEINDKVELPVATVAVALLHYDIM